MTSPALRGLYQSFDNGTYKQSQTLDHLFSFVFGVGYNTSTYIEEFGLGLPFWGVAFTDPNPLGARLSSGMSWGWSVSNLVTITSMIPMFHKFSQVVKSICRVAVNTKILKTADQWLAYQYSLVICCSLLSRMCNVHPFSIYWIISILTIFHSELFTTGYPPIQHPSPVASAQRIRSRKSSEFGTRGT